MPAATWGTPLAIKAIEFTREEEEEEEEEEDTMDKGSVEEEEESTNREEVRIDLSYVTPPGSPGGHVINIVLCDRVIFDVVHVSLVISTLPFSACGQYSFHHHQPPLKTLTKDSVWVGVNPQTLECPPGLHSHYLNKVLLEHVVKHILPINCLLSGPL